MENPDIIDKSRESVNTQEAGKTTEMKTAPGQFHDPENNSRTLTQLAEVQPYQDIIDFLGKPIYIGNSTFSTSTSRGSQMFFHKPSTTIDPILGDPMWLSKLQGFYSMRGTFVYDIIVNATPFHAGAFLANFFPTNSLLLENLSMHVANLTATSQHPGSIICNINKDHYIVKIPFIAPTEMYPLSPTNGTPDFGQFSIWCWSPLLAGAAAANSITLSIWGHWEDVTLGPVFPQAAQNARRNKKVIVKKRNPIEAETNSGKGPISSMLSSVSLAADALSDIPMISSIASTVSWASSIASGVASAFGFSAPRTNVGPKLIVGGSLFSRNANSDKFDPSVHLATVNDGKVCLIEGKSVYQGDEMAISFIKSRPAYMDNFQYTTSNTVGQRIYSYALSPLSARVPYTYDGLNCIQYTPVGALARSFWFYTGGLKLRVKLFKTAFHAGTLVFAFVPNDTSTAWTLQQTAPLNRYVLDIQTEDSFEMEFPYQSPDPWLQVVDYIGSMHVYAFTPLRAPESVSQSIDITIEILGADDLVFSNPVTSGATPLLPQGAVEEVNEESVNTIGDTHGHPDSLQFSETCIGEQIVSIKQLLNRYHRVQANTNKAQFTAAPSFRLLSNVVGCAKRVSSSHTTTFSPLYGTPFDFWSLCYAYRRGGTRWGIMREGVATRQGIMSSFSGCTFNWPNDVYVSNTPDEYTFIPTSNASSGTYGSYWTPPTLMPAKEGGNLVSVPYMSRYTVSPNEPWFDPSLPVPKYAYQPSTYITFKSYDATDDVTLIRSVDDHFQLKYFVGIPLVVDGPL